MSMPKLYIKRGDDSEFEISDAVNGLEFLSDDDSPVMLNTYQANVPVDGQMVTSTNYDKSVVTANFTLMFGTWADFKLAKHEIYSIFNQREIMRLRTDSEPNKVKFVKPVSFDIKPISDGANIANFSIPFENPSGYKYSLVRSDALYTFDSGFWQQGMNLPSDKDFPYHFTTTSFDVYNASDITIDPYWQHHDLQIIISFAGSILTLTNTTNNSSWSYQKPATKSDKIILDGINTTLNGTPASINTDYGNITLDQGWNSISVTGATDVDITFSFPFIYIG